MVVQHKLIDWKPLFKFFPSAVNIAVAPSLESVVKISKEMLLSLRESIHQAQLVRKRVNVEDSDGGGGI